LNTQKKKNDRIVISSNIKKTDNVIEMQYVLWEFKIPVDYIAIGDLQFTGDLQLPWFKIYRGLNCRGSKL